MPSPLIDDETMRPSTKRALLLTGLGLLVLYAGEDLSLRYRIPRGREPFGSVQVNHFMAVPLKNGKSEFDFTGAEAESCVRAIFPHLAKSPCWYLSRHNEKREDI